MDEMEESHYYTGLDSIIMEEKGTNRASQHILDVML